MPLDVGLEALRAPSPTGPARSALPGRIVVPPSPASVEAPAAPAADERPTATAVPAGCRRAALQAPPIRPERRRGTLPAPRGQRPARRGAGSARHSAFLAVCRRVPDGRQASARSAPQGRRARRIAVHGGDAAGKHARAVGEHPGLARALEARAHGTRRALRPAARSGCGAAGDRASAACRPRVGQPASRRHTKGSVADAIPQSDSGAATPRDAGGRPNSSRNGRCPARQASPAP